MTKKQILTKFINDTQSIIDCLKTTPDKGKLHTISSQSINLLDCLITQLEKDLFDHMGEVTNLVTYRQNNDDYVKIFKDRKDLQKLKKLKNIENVTLYHATQFAYAAKPKRKKKTNEKIKEEQLFKKAKNKIAKDLPAKL